jgi:predicted aspartyl protease
MGVVFTKVRIYGLKGSKELNLIDDTGATFTKVPFSIANEIGIEWKEEIEVELSDGNIKIRKLGAAEVEIDGIRRFIPLTAAEDERGFIGYTTLEILGLKVNPITQKLERTTAIEY